VQGAGGGIAPVIELATLARCRCSANVPSSILRSNSCFESATAGELITRLGAHPRLREALSERLPPKILSLSSGQKSQAVLNEYDESDMPGHVERMVARIESATFTGRNDAKSVPQLYKGYVLRIAEVGALTHHHKDPMPCRPMPIDVCTVRCGTLAMAGSREDARIPAAGRGG
jgi:hypothetical protein